VLTRAETRARGRSDRRTRDALAALIPLWAYFAWDVGTALPISLAAAPMIHDHEAIVARIERLERADVDDVDSLQELLYGLHALISVHFRKEEDLQLPAFDAAPRETTEAVLRRMEAAAGHTHEHTH
jgi:hypothetical protein